MRLARSQAALLLAAAVPTSVVALTGRTPAPMAAAFGAIGVVTAGLLVLQSWLRRSGLAAVAVPAGVLTLYGTALVWHELVEPGLAAAAFLAGAILVRASAPREDAPFASAAGRGILLGLALTLAAFVPEVLGGATRTPALGAPVLLDMLFSSRHGVLFWTPVLTVGVAGLFGRAAGGGRDAVGALAALAVMALIDAAVRPWWAGGFANARLLPALPLLALGLAHALQALRRAVERRPLAMAAAAGGLLVLWNQLLMAQYADEMIPRDDTVSFPAVAENAAVIVSAAAGAPVTWPASWVFAVRHHLPASRFDLLGGQDVLAGGATRLDLGRPETEAAALGEGWSVRHPCGSAVCREIEGGRARMYLPAVDAVPAEVTVRAQGSGSLAVRVNGVPLATASLTGASLDLGGVAPLRRGPNEVQLEVSPGGRAAVETVSVRRAGEGR